MFESLVRTLVGVADVVSALTVLAACFAWLWTRIASQLQSRRRVPESGPSEINAEAEAQENPLLERVSTEPPERIELSTFSLPWKRSAD